MVIIKQEMERLTDLKNEIERLSERLESIIINVDDKFYYKKHDLVFRIVCKYAKIYFRFILLLELHLY